PTIHPHPTLFRAGPRRDDLAHDRRERPQVRMEHVLPDSRIGHEHDDRRYDREEWVEEVRIVATPPGVFKAPSGELRGPPEESLIVLCRRRRSKAAGRPQFANLRATAHDHED